VFDPFFGGFGMMALLAILLNLAFVVFVVVVVMLGVRWLMRNTNTPPGGGPAAPGGWSPAKPEDNALAVLRERFARGEIDAEEFEQRRRTLGS
jgi:putative membrane protein